MSKEQSLKFEELCANGTVEEVIEIAIQNDLLPVIKYFIENGGNPHFIIKSNPIVLINTVFTETRNILNVAAEENSLNVINYLLDNNVFTVDQRASENSITAFHSAIENENFEAAKLLLKKGADINAKYFWHNDSCPILKSIFIGDGNEYGIKMAKFLVKHGIQIPDDIDSLCSDLAEQKFPSKRIVKDFLLSIKKLDNSFNDSNNAYKNASPEIQEIWDIRVLNLAQEDGCTKILGTVLLFDHQAI